MAVYLNPPLNGHKVLYKGKRYRMFEVSADHPFENYEGTCQFLIFDKSISAVCGWCNLSDDGTYLGYIQYGQGSIDFNGKTPKELVQQMVYWYNWIERTWK